MSLPAKPASARPPATSWNYVELRVLDGECILRPTHVAFDRLIFAYPPNLSSQYVEVIVTNNGQSHSRRARVLPHDRASTRIPIQLIDEQQKASTRLTA